MNLTISCHPHWLVFWYKQATVIFHLDYSDHLLLVSVLVLVQSLLKKSSWVILLKPKSQYVFLFKSFQWLPIVLRVKAKIPPIAYGALHDLLLVLSANTFPSGLPFLGHTSLLVLDGTFLTCSHLRVHATITYLKSLIKCNLLRTVFLNNKFTSWKPAHSSSNHSISIPWLIFLLPVILWYSLCFA